MEASEARSGGQACSCIRRSLSQQRTAEWPPTKKVKLLSGTPTISFGQPIHMLQAIARYRGPGARIEIGLAYEFEPMRRGCGKEIEKLEGVIVLGQELTEDVGGRYLCQLPRFRTQDHAIGTGPGALLQSCKRRPGARHTRLQVLIGPGVEAQNILDWIAQMPSRQDVVADGSNAAIAEAAADEAENGRLHRRRDPAENAVTNHVVEASSRQLHIGKIRFLERHILELEKFDAPFAIGNLTCRQINAEKTCLRPSRCQWQQIAP